MKIVVRLGAATTVQLRGLPASLVGMSLARDRRIVATSVAALTGLALYSSRSTWLDLIMSLNNGTEGQSSKVAQKTASSSHDGGDVSTAAKSVSDSSFECSYPVTPDMCDSNGRLYVRAATLGYLGSAQGLCTGRRAAQIGRRDRWRCVSQAQRLHDRHRVSRVRLLSSLPGPISADSIHSRVVFLQEIRVGDVVHLSVSVNRAWSTSLETGVRCMREDGHTGKRTYACHGAFSGALSPSP